MISRVPRVNGSSKFTQKPYELPRCKHMCKGRSLLSQHSATGLPFPSLQHVAHSLTPQQLYLFRAEPRVRSKNKLYQLGIISSPKLQTVLTLRMLLAVQICEMCFLKYNFQNGFESKERESQPVETTRACVLKLK